MTPPDPKGPSLGRPKCDPADSASVRQRRPARHALGRTDARQLAEVNAGPIASQWAIGHVDRQPLTDDACSQESVVSLGLLASLELEPHREISSRKIGFWGAEEPFAANVAELTRSANYSNTREILPALCLNRAAVEEVVLLGHKAWAAGTDPAPAIKLPNCVSDLIDDMPFDIEGAIRVTREVVVYIKGGASVEMDVESEAAGRTLTGFCVDCRRGHVSEGHDGNEAGYYAQ